MVQELQEESFSTHVEKIGVVTLHPKMEFITKENMNIYLSYTVPSNKLVYMHNPITNPLILTSHMKISLH